MRPLSCTNLFSKVLEFFLLQRLKSTVIPQHNQFGGISGSSTSHYLIEAWNEILESLDQEETAVNLTSVDFEKAFNTMQHAACVNAFVRMSAALRQDDSGISPRTDNEI